MNTQTTMKGKHKKAVNILYISQHKEKSPFNKNYLRTIYITRSQSFNTVHIEASGVVKN